MAVNCRTIGHSKCRMISRNYDKWVSAAARGSGQRADWPFSFPPKNRNKFPNMGRQCQRWYMVDEFTNCSLLNAHRGRLMPALRGVIRRRNQAVPSVDCLCHLCPIASHPVEIAQLDWLIYGEDVMAMIVGGNRAIPYGCCAPTLWKGKPGHRWRGARVLGGRTSGQHAGRIGVGKVEVGCHLLGEQRAIVC
jgi:hypothetical protein